MLAKFAEILAHKASPTRRISSETAVTWKNIRCQWSVRLTQRDPLGSRYAIDCHVDIFNVTPRIVDFKSFGLQDPRRSRFTTKRRKKTDAKIYFAVLPQHMKKYETTQERTMVCYEITLRDGSLWLNCIFPMTWLHWGPHGWPLNLVGRCRTLLLRRLGTYYK